MYRRTKTSFLPHWPFLLAGMTAFIPVSFAAPNPSTAEPSPTPASAPPMVGLPLTVDAAVRWALETSPHLRASESRIEAAAGRAQQARLWDNPELELAAEDWSVDPDRSFSTSKRTIGITQSVPWPGKKRLDGDLGLFSVRLGETSMELRRLTLEREVRAAFIRTLAADRRIAVGRELLLVATESAGAARKKAEAGSIPLQEQLRAELQIEHAQATLEDLEQDRDAARQILAHLLGWPDLGETTLSGSLADHPDPALLAQTPESWLENHPATRAARTEQAQAEIAIRRARLETFPDVRLGMSGGVDGASDAGIMELRVSLPLPLIDRSKGRRLEATANARALEAETGAVEQMLRRDWRLARDRYRSAALRVSAYKERILPLADEALRLVRLGFEEGKFGFIDLVDTQRTTAEARLAYQERLLELNLAGIELASFSRPAPLAPGVASTSSINPHPIP